MCFGGSGGNQGGSGSQEDAEVRRSHSKAGISAAETRRYFRERDNPAHSRNENAPGASTSVSHSRDEGGNLVSQRVEYGQGNFSDGSMKAENILGKRDDVFSVGNDLSVGGKIFSNARLSKSGNSIISTDPNNVGTIGGITSGGGLWGGREVQSALGVGAQDSRGIATGLITPRLAAQNLSRTKKFQETSNQFVGKTPAEIAAIRAANRAKNPADQDGDGSWLTSTDDMGRVYGIGTTTNPDGSMKGDGAQPVIYDPTLPEAYRGIPQLDPNRASDPNLTMFGKGMRTASRFVPYVGALDLADKKGFIPDVLKGNTGRGTDIGSLEDLKTTPSGEITRGDNFTYAPTTFATSNESSPNPFGAFNNLRPQLRPTKSGANTFDEAYRDQYGDKGENIKYYSGTPDGMPTSRYFREGDLSNDANFNQVMPPSTTGSLDAPLGERRRFKRNNQQYIDMGARGEPMKAGGYVTEPDATNYIDPSRFVNYAYNNSGSDDNDDSPYIRTTQNMTSDNEQSIYDRFNYRKYAPINPALIAQSSYGGKFGSGQPNYMTSGLPAGIYSGSGPSAQVLTDFYNPVTGEYYTAPNAGYYAEEGSDWRRGRPTEAYNLA